MLQLDRNTYMIEMEKLTNEILALRSIVQVLRDELQGVREEIKRLKYYS